MPTIEEIKNKWPDIDFKVSKCVPDDVMSIKFKEKFVHLPFTIDIKLSALNDFQNRILNPCISAIETKIKQEKLKCLNNF